MDTSKYHLEKLSRDEGREYIINNHYSQGCGYASMIWGLIDDKNNIRGAAAYQTPISEAVRKAVFETDEENCWCSHLDEEHGFHQHVTELHRLVTDDDLPNTMTSWFVSQSLDKLKEYKPKYWAVVSHADMSEDHTGTIYQATNAIYTGMTGQETKFYRKPDGTLKPPRNCGDYISPEEARERGWSVEKRQKKHRYIFLLPDGNRHKRWIDNHLAYEEKEYPK